VELHGPTQVLKEHGRKVRGHFDQPELWQEERSRAYTEPVKDKEVEAQPLSGPTV